MVSDDFMNGIQDAMSQIDANGIKQFQLCDACLGRLFAKVGMGMENLKHREIIGTNYDSTTALVAALQELQTQSGDIESGLVPATVKSLNVILGTYSHLVLFGEMASNKAWVGALGTEGGINMSVMDYRSGYSLYQGLASLSLHPPYEENERLMDLGFAWETYVYTKTYTYT